MFYWFYVFKDYDFIKLYFLVLFLYGGGEWGNDNIK